MTFGNASHAGIVPVLSRRTAARRLGQAVLPSRSAAAAISAMFTSNPFSQTARRGRARTRGTSPVPVAKQRHE